MAASSKPSFQYSSGRDETKVDSPSAFIMFARNRLGVEMPVGNARRGVLYRELKEEMSVQGWAWEDLVQAVEYVAETGSPCRTAWGVLYYVERAKKWAKERQVEDLHEKVARAVQMETDKTWQRKLSLAKGDTLRLVYLEWLNERKPVL